MSDNAKELLARSSRLFSARETLLSQWQEMSEQFYPERADFTVIHTDGTRFAEKLYTADPVMMSRDLANAFTWLRAEDRDWFALHVEDEALEKSTKVKVWLEDKTKVMRRVMYDKKARFNRAMKEGERDYAVFGNAVTSCEINQSNDGLRYLTHHLRDCAGAENSDGRIDTVYRKISMTARQVVQYFTAPGDVIHDTIKRCLERDGNKDQPFEIIHCMMPAEDYEYERGKGKGLPWISIYLDVGNSKLIRESSAYEFRYVWPRWQTISGSVYGVSPAAVVALPEARMLQELARIIQEAGEKAIDPPMTAIEENIRGDVKLQAGGLTWLDVEGYNSKTMGKIIEPMFLAKNPGLGIELFLKSIATLKDAWFVSKLSLPTGKDMTAFEVSKLIEEHIRANVPLTEPIENEYYTPGLDLTASVLLRLGVFGLPAEMPEELRGRDLSFRFSNPLRDVVARGKVAQFQTALNLIGMAKTADPSAPVEMDFDIRTGFRDAVEGAGCPADWLVDKNDADRAVEERQEQQAAQAEAAQIGGAAGVAEQVGNAGQALGLIQGAKKAA